MLQQVKLVGASWDGAQLVGAGWDGVRIVDRLGWLHFWDSQIEPGDYVMSAVVVVLYLLLC